MIESTHWLPKLVAVGLAAAIPAQDEDRLPEFIRLQLRGVEGKPVEEESIGVILETAGRRWFERVETDSRGVLGITIPDGFRAAREGTLWLHRGKWPSEKLDVQTDGESRFVPERTPERYIGAKMLAFAGLRDSGILPVRLEKPKLVFAGRVVDRQGKPIRHARVSIGDTGSLVENWREIRSREMLEFAVLTDADGHFAIHDSFDGLSRVKLRVEYAGHRLLAGANPSLGDTDTKIILGRVSKVLGEIKDMPRGGSMPFTASMVRHDPLFGRRSFDSHFWRGGEFRIDDCFAGTYDFVLRSEAGGGKTIFEVKNVKVEAGKDCRDPRLAAIDISDRFRWIEVEFASMSDEPLGRVRLEIEADPIPHLTYVGSPGKLLIPKTGAKLTAHANGFRSKIIENVKDDVKIVLAPACKVVLRIRNLPELDAAEVELRRVHKSRPSFTQQLPVDTLDSAKDTAILPVEKAGAIRFELVAIVAGEQPNSGYRRPAKEFIKLGHREVLVKSVQLEKKQLAFDLTLTPVELAVLQSFEEVLKERTR